MHLFSAKILRRQDIALLVALLLACLVMFALPTGAKQGLGNRVVGFFFAPLELPVFQFKSLLVAWRENASLRQELAAVQLKNIALAEAQRENDRLRSMLGLAGRWSWTTIASQVAGREPALLAPDLLIDKGSAIGLSGGMIAFTADGVVGRIAEVRRDDATVQTIFDPKSRVSAIVLRSRVLGIFRTVRGSSCILDRVPIRSDVRAGDTIVTSGYGRLFPFGLLLGVVENVASNNRSLTCLVTVRPVLDVNRLSHLFVITGGANPPLPGLETAAAPGLLIQSRKGRSSLARVNALQLSLPALRIELPDTLKLQPERGQ